VSAEFAPSCEDLARFVADPPEAPPERSPEEWERFREVARVHGAAPLLWLRVRDLPAWSASPVGAWLADQHSWNGLRVARLHSELREILAALATAGVPLLPLKGGVLSVLYYEEPAARPMADLDVLLPEEHWEAGEAALASAGYAKTFDGWKHSRFARPGPREVVDREREHPDNPRLLEVHPRCRERLLGEVVDLTDLVWGTAVPGELLGVPCRLPRPDALWPYLLVHATHHVMLNNFRLLHLLDLIRLEPFLDRPEEGLACVDPRAVYPALALLDRYAPSGRAERLREELRGRLSAGYADWADGLDLFSVCYLNPVPWRDS
jgi:hypothetical protein